MTIEQDIELAKYLDAGEPQLADGTGQRDVCYRLALEVERLRSIIEAPKAPTLPKVGDAYLRGTARIEVVAVDETHASYKNGEHLYKYTIPEFMSRASETLRKGAQFIPAK